MRGPNRKSALAVLTVGAAVVAAVVVLSRSDRSNRVTALAPTTPTNSTRPATSTSLGPGSAEIATATAPEVPVFATPGGSAPVKTFPNPWFINADRSAPVPMVFAVKQQREGWIEVLLPVRPNGSTGWVRSTDVTLSVTGYRITVALGTHRLRAVDGDNVLVDEKVAIGAPATPTPTGSYYIFALLKAPDPSTVYGPYAYGLSGHSEVLQSFAGGDAEVGIHGNNDASVLGKSVSHGCIRMSNDAIARLAAALPLGTPVTITA